MTTLNVPPTQPNTTAWLDHDCGVKDSKCGRLKTGTCSNFFQKGKKSTFIKIPQLTRFGLWHTTLFLWWLHHLETIIWSLFLDFLDLLCYILVGKKRETSRYCFLSWNKSLFVHFLGTQISDGEKYCYQKNCFFILPHVSSSCVQKKQHLFKKKTKKQKN